jgi:MFS family permease
VSERADLDGIAPGDYRRNFAAGLVHGVFFQASAALSSIHTVLPSFVALLTPSAIAVGLMAAVQDAGEIVPQLATAYRLQGRTRNKPILLVIITIRWVSWLVLAWLTWAFAADHPGPVLVVLLVLFSVFSVSGGIGTVVFADVFSKAIPARRRGRFIGLRQLLGYGAAIAAGSLVGWALSDAGPGFPADYALIFACTAGALLVAFGGFLMIREPAVPSRRIADSMDQMIRRAIVLARRNPNFRRLMWARGVVQAGLALSPFYVVYALEDRGIDPAMVGVLLSVQMAGAALSNLLFGWLADRRGNRSVILLTVTLGLLTPLTALAAPAGDAAFVVVFVLLGATMSGLRLGFPNILLEMASVSLRPTCVALLNTLLAPVSLLPLAVGALTVVVPYPILFGIGAALALPGLVAGRHLIDPRDDPQGACIEE